jgi:hypothetical protein
MTTDSSATQREETSNNTTTSPNDTTTSPNDIDPSYQEAGEIARDEWVDTKSNSQPHQLRTAEQGSEACSGGAAC